MRRLFGVVLVCSSLAFMGAAPSPSPSPSPLPAKAAPAKAAVSASPSATPAIPNALPAVVVYPFDTPTDVKADIGLNIAQIFQQVFLNANNLNVLAVGQGVKRADYQTYARSKHADYYVAGYVQPIGQSAAVVAQLVNVNSGTSVYSQTAQIATLQDVASEALTFDSAIQTFEHPDTLSVQTTTEATPAPDATNGASMKVGLGGLFKGKGKATGATPAPAIVKPSRGVIVTRLNGNATNDLTTATNQLLASFNTRYNARLATVNPPDVSKSSDAICGTQRNNTVTSGTLNVHREGSGFRAHDVYDFTLNVYTCFGSKLYTTSTTDRNFAKAIDDAVAAYAKDAPQNG